MASCGLDSAISIWSKIKGDTLTKFSLSKRIENAHSGFIKGIAFKPTQPLILLSQAEGEDGMALWKVPSGEKLTNCFEAFIAESPTSSFFKRPAWSPDGSTVILANALNGYAPCAVAISYEEFSAFSNDVKSKKNTNNVTWTSFIGHVTPIEVVSCFPFQFKCKDYPEKIIIIACGSQDGTVTVWTNISERPIAVFDGLFEHAVMDLGWSNNYSNGQTALFTASYDGTVAKIDMELSKLLECINGALGIFEIIDDHELNNNNQQKLEIRSETSKLDVNLLTKNTLATTKDGKRRLAPQLLSTSTITQLNTNFTTNQSSKLDEKASHKCCGCWSNFLQEKNVKNQIKNVKNQINGSTDRTRDVNFTIRFNCIELEIAYVKNTCRLSVFSTTSTAKTFLWKENFVDQSNIMAFLSNKAMWLAFESGSLSKLYIVSPWTGRNLAIPITINSPIVYMSVLDTRPDYTTIITSVGFLYNFALEENSIIMKDRVPIPLPLVPDKEDMVWNLFSFERNGRLTMYLDNQKYSTIFCAESKSWIVDQQVQLHYTDEFILSKSNKTDLNEENCLQGIELALIDSLNRKDEAALQKLASVYMTRCFDDVHLVSRLREWAHKEPLLLKFLKTRLDHTNPLYLELE